ncbi:MAG: hypothetical protein JKY15_06160 [Deltaproteobacteria bacterium]|nr:hypothetical protein [Deltaproteobacteria bacterium]
MFPLFLQAKTFEPQKDRWSVGGSASLPFKGTEKGVLSLKLNLEPSISCFVFDHIEVSGNLRLGLTILSGERNGFRDPVQWGLGLSSRYVFGSQQTIYPYIGLLGSVDLQNWWAETLEWRSGIWTGFLVVLQESWVLDVGFPIIAAFSSERFQYIEVILGQVGLNYYF